jgi:hypothetical protein
MARHFTVRCESCQVDGPFLRRTGRVAFLASLDRRRDPPSMLKRTDAEPVWAAFLDEHEFHDLTLRPT